VWTRPDAHRIDVAHTALLVFDMLECYRGDIESSGALPRVQQLVELARSSGMPVCFARAAHRPDGADFTRVVADVDRWYRPWDDAHPQASAPEADADYRSLAELGQSESDIDIPKHRWSAFHGTALDLTLRVQNIDTVVICGGSTHVGVASTVYAGRDLDYQMIVAKDACTGHREQRDYFCETIFPRMVRVRTVAEISTMMTPSERTPA
jgi:nicotinamidase-related amidase